MFYANLLILVMYCTFHSFHTISLEEVRGHGDSAAGTSISIFLISQKTSTTKQMFVNVCNMRRDT